MILILYERSDGHWVSPRPNQTVFNCLVLVKVAKHSDDVLYPCGVTVTGATARSRCRRRSNAGGL
jgi:hypothetical protein